MTFSHEEQLRGRMGKGKTFLLFFAQYSDFRLMEQECAWHLPLE